MSSRAKRSTVFQTGCLIVSVIVRTLFQMMLPINARCDFVDDDALMVSYARSIANGEWLGSYTYHTLNKMPGFSIMLAFFKTFNIPYMLWVGLFYSMACIIFFFAIKKYIRKWWPSFGCYLFLLFAPEMFDKNVGQAAYRLSILPALLLMIVSAYMVLLRDRRKTFKRNAKWIVLISASLLTFVMSREEAAFLYCFIYGATAVLIILFIIECKSRKKWLLLTKYVMFLIIPILVTNLGKVCLKYANYKIYGVYTDTDFSATYYVDVCKDIVTIKPTEEVKGVYVTRDTMDRCFEYSETLNTIKDYVDDFYENPDTSGLREDGELDGGFFAWIMRWSAFKAGYYEDAQTANQFYKQVHEELQKGFEDGTFEKKDALVLSGLSRPIGKGDMSKILKYAFLGMVGTADFTSMYPQYQQAFGSDEQIRMFEEVTSTNIGHNELSGFEFGGWMFAVNNDSKISMEIYDNNGNSLKPGFEESEDIYEIYNRDSEKVGFYTENAANARFSVYLPVDGSLNVKKLFVKITVDNEIVYNDSIYDVKDIKSDKIRVGIENCRKTYISTENKQQYKTNIKFVKGFLFIYKLIYPVFWWFMSIGFMLIDFIANIVKKKKGHSTRFSRDIMMLGILMTAFANHVIVSINYFESHPYSFRKKYVAGSYPLLQVFTCLGVLTIVQLIIEMKKEDYELFAEGGRRSKKSKHRRERRKGSDISTDSSGPSTSDSSKEGTDSQIKNRLSDGLTDDNFGNTMNLNLPDNAATNNATTKTTTTAGNAATSNTAAGNTAAGVATPISPNNTAAGVATPTSPNNTAAGVATPTSPNNTTAGNTATGNAGSGKDSQDDSDEGIIYIDYD